MSMVICEHCDALIDSDDDPHCFVEVGNMRRQTHTEIICDNCRERIWDRMQEEFYAGDRHQSVQEQYVAAWHEKQRLS